MAFLLLGIFLTYLATGQCAFDVHADVVVDFSPYEDTWETFKRQFGRNFTADEEAIRFKTFVERLKTMESHNRDYLANRASYYMGIGPFTDKIHPPCDVPSGEKTGDDEKSGLFFDTYKRPRGFTPQTALNWKDCGVVTPVQDQGNCYSCYAFGVTATLEAQVMFATKSLIPLSQQQQVDCLENGCEGSSAHTAFSYVYTAKGLKTALRYPYTNKTRRQGSPGRCRFKEEEAQAKVSKVFVTKNESDLQYMVASEGPVFINFRQQPDFQSYKGGVYSNTSCTGRTNHCLTIIGYGYNATLMKDYWIVKNSWGTNWGMNGIAYIERGKGICGIGRYAAVPIYQRPRRGKAALERGWCNTAASTGST